MDEIIQEEKSRGNSPKKLITIIVAALLVIGVGVAAFTLLNKSAKEKYFLAEYKSMNFIVNQFEDRYKPEFDWYETQKEKAVEANWELSGEYNGASLQETGLEALNSSSLKIKTATDFKNKLLGTEVTANISGLSIGGLEMYLTEDKLMTKLPFVKDTLLIHDKDLPRLLHEADPEAFTGKEEIDFGSLFDTQSAISEKDQEYLKKEYGLMIYNEITEESFKTEKEKVTVNKKEISSEKITLHLTEKQFKNISVNVLNKMKKDKHLEEMIRKQFAANQFGLSMPSTNAVTGDQANDIINEFKDSLDEMKKEIEKASIPNGLKSTIWTNDDVIVKRALAFEAGPSKNELTKITVKGTQSLNKEAQVFNYILGFKNNTDDGELVIDGDFKLKGTKGTDSLKLAVDDMAVKYTGKDTLKNGKRDFKRTIAVEQADSEDLGSLHWDGNIDYQADHVDAMHTFTLDAPMTGLAPGDLAIHIKQNAKVIKKVEIPKDGPVKDIGKMSLEEIETYFQTDVLPLLGQLFN